MSGKKIEIDPCGCGCGVAAFLVLVALGAGLAWRAFKWAAGVDL